MFFLVGLRIPRVLSKKEVNKKGKDAKRIFKPCYKVAGNAEKNVKAEFFGMALSGTALTHRFCLLITSA